MNEGASSSAGPSTRGGEGEVPTRSLTPPLTLQQQLELLQQEVQKLKSGHKVSTYVYSWKEVPPFNPDLKTLSVNKWVRLVDQRAYFLRWDDVTTTQFAVENLAGRARDCLLNTDVTYRNWSDLKTFLRNTFDIDPNATGKLFVDAANYNSGSARNYVDYYNNKLFKLNRLAWAIPEKDKVNIIVTGITEEKIRHVAFTNNYDTVDDVLTYLRTCDHESSTATRGKEQAPPATKYKRPLVSNKPTEFKITCYGCNQPGHKIVNCPSRRQ